MTNSHASSDLRRIVPQHPVPAATTQSFMGYHRADSRVGTRNYWLVIPLFSGETHQFALVKEAFLCTLGYRSPNLYEQQLRALREQYRAGSYFDTPLLPPIKTAVPPLFANIDGVKFLPNFPALSASQSVADPFWKTLAGYCAHPNVGGITVLTMGEADHSQSGDPRSGDPVDALRHHIGQCDPAFAKPLLIVNRFVYATEFDWLTVATRDTFRAMAELNRQTRQPASLSHITVGIHCREANRFSVPASVGEYVNLITGLGATVMLTTPNTYTDAAGEIHPLRADSQLASEPNVKHFRFPGDPADATTALTAAGCTLHLSLTGTSTPTGNPIAPVVVATPDQALVERLSDWIDIDPAGHITGDTAVTQTGETLLSYFIKLASGEQQTQSETRGHDEFRLYQS